MSRTFVCSSCGTYDFDGLFDLRFYNRLCCEYVLVEENPISSKQTMLLHGHSRPSMGIYHWSWFVGSED